MSGYFTTKELAEFLRIKERKVYDLAASGKVPCSKAMGKLLFPKAEIEAWVASERTGPVASKRAVERPNVFLGSHDPLLDWALRESQSGLATYFDGSVDGLRRFEAGEGIATGLHLFDDKGNDWNTERVLAGCSGLPAVLIEWARRQRGLIVAPGSEKQFPALNALKGRRFAARQDDAGAQVLFRQLLADTQVRDDELDTVVAARTETDAALAVLDGKADACFGLKSLASQYRLGFVPIIEERFDLLVDRRAWFEPPIQSFIAFCGSNAFRMRACELDGYDVGALGTIHYNGP